MVGQRSDRGKVYPPRVRGNRGNAASPKNRHGLSPRVRGNRLANENINASRGSIPACAGEPSGSLFVGITSVGLSPRVRGNPDGYGSG